MVLGGMRGGGVCIPQLRHLDFSLILGYLYHRTEELQHRATANLNAFSHVYLASPPFAF